MDVLIIGASARAAAGSAHRAGLRPAAVDQFGDVDLRATTTGRYWSGEARELVEHAASLPAGPWLYTGALENDPGVVERLSGTRTLWGNGRTVLEQVRDPRGLADCLATVGPYGLETRPHDDPPPRDGRWVLKPLRSAAGRGIARWTTGCRTEPTAAHVFQQYALGLPYSALFVAGETEADLVGVTRQLTAAGNPFEWRGNLGPVEVPLETETALRRIGEGLTRTFGLRGLVGIDFLLEDASDPATLSVTEVNPRYTGSVELLEHATGRPLLAEHARCFGADVVVERRPPWSGCLVKWIAFASRPFEFRGLVDRSLGTDPWALPDVADRPRDGTPIETGQPVCTLFGSGRTPKAAFEEVACRAERTLVETSDGGESLAELVEAVSFDG